MTSKIGNFDDTLDDEMQPGPNQKRHKDFQNSLCLGDKYGRILKYPT